MLAFTLLAAGFAWPAAAATDARVNENYGKLPLQFEANRGQTQKDVRFLSHGPGYNLYLTAGEAVLVLTKPNPDAKRDVRDTQARPDAKAPLKSVALRMSLVGATRDPQVSGLDELPGKANYFVGRDRSKWHTNVPTYAKVQYGNVYPGIDLVYYGNQRQLEYDFVVAPGADPKKIVLGFKGADKLEIGPEGDLVLHAGGGNIRQHRPVIYQEIDGIRRKIAGSYVRKGANRVGFQVAAYDTTRPLVIDPVLSYSTFLGGGSGFAIAVDATGAAYVVGGTGSADFPTTPGAFDTSFNGGDDVFITKLNAAGSALVYSTFLGGSSDDLPSAIAVDATGAVYVTGFTSSPSDFPTTPGAFDTSFNGGSTIIRPADVFVTKLDPAGSTLVYSTFLGGSGNEFSIGIAVDAMGAAYVTGTTDSTDFPTTPGAFDTSFKGGFVTKLNAAGSALVYSTFLGGSGCCDATSGIAVDATGAAYVTGTTFSVDFPTTPGALNTSFNAGFTDAFVTKLDANGSALVYSTYLGGSSSEGGSGIFVDATGAAYVTGNTSSADFPTTAGAFDRSPNGGPDVFVTKLNATGSALVYSTYLGGKSDDFGKSISVDSAGAAYVTGSTNSTDFPTTAGAFDTSLNGGRTVTPLLGGGGGPPPPPPTDVFITKLDAAGSALVYSSFLGGSRFDSGSGTVDATGSAYMTGGTSSSDFPTTPGAFNTGTGGGGAFVTKLSGIALLVIDKDGIDDKRPPNFFSEIQVNDDVAALGVRAQLRFFRDQVSQTITLPAGEVGDEGWFALKTIPASWAQAGGAAGFVGNPAANPEDPAPQGTGPGLGAPDATGDPDSLLKNVPNVTPLQATALSNLIGREVCAVVYDNQVGINQDHRTGDLRGANLGTVAFQVVSLAAPSGDASSTSLPGVQVRILDARTICRGPFALLTDAEAPLQ